MNLKSSHIIIRGLIITMILMMSYPLLAQQTNETSSNESIFKRVVRSSTDYIQGKPWAFDSLLPLTHHKLLFGYTYSGIIDSYLSPLAHRGSGGSIIWTDDNPSHDKSYHLYRERRVILYKNNNVANRTALYHFGGEYNIGGLFQLYQSPNFLLSAGPLYNLSIYNHLKLSNTNNAYDLKASTGIDLYGRALYKINNKILPVIIAYSAQLSALHLTFHPEYGQSYYDYISGENRGNIVLTLTTPINRTLFRQRLLIDLPIHHLTWTIGLEHTYHHERLSSLDYKKGSLGLFVGVSFDILRLSGNQSYRSKQLANSYYN